MTDQNTISIAPMRTDHIHDVVRVHLASFPGYFLSFLGPRFLRLFFTEIIKEHDHIAFVALSEAEVIGYVVGVTEQSGFYSRLAHKRKFAFASAALGAVLHNIRIIPRLFRALSYERMARLAASPALLMSIAVSPKTQQGGVGKKLTFAFLSEMKKRNIDKVSLTTDRDDNERVNSFYKKLGFTIFRSYVTPEGRGMNEYVIDLTDWSPSHEETQVREIAG